MILISQIGCLLPLLIILNLFFGLMFFSPVIWLTVGIVLVFLFLANSYLAARKLKKTYLKKRRVIDIEASVVEEDD